MNLPWLRRFAKIALEECAGLSGDGKFDLEAIEEITVAIVSDRRIAALHVEFMGIEGPTDVITFEHGDIAIGAETARAQAKRYGQAVDREVALYIVHGLLHLNGFDDTNSRARRRMHAVQLRAMRTCLGRMKGA